MVVYGVQLQRSSDLALPEHPDGCTADAFRDWCQERLDDGTRLAVDLFSGAGGLSLGLEAAGWTVAAAVDSDGKALQTHRHNFAGLTVTTDLSDPDRRQALVDALEGVPIDLVAGGPPCQPFSRAGRSKIRSLVEAGQRDEHDHRRELWRAFLDVALAIRPRAVLMENVPDMALGDGFAVVRIMTDRLERAGYNVDFRLVDASRYGVPQHRKRLILLARRDAADFDWPTPCSTVTTLRDAIVDLPDLGDSTGGRELTYRGPRRPTEFAASMRNGAPPGLVWDHMTRPVRDDDREIFGLMNSTTLYANIPARYRRYKVESFDDKYKKLDWDSVSRSITAHIAKDGYWYIHPEQLRTLTVREAARIQTFPDRFRFAGTRSDAFRQIGNAVPPALGEKVAGALLPETDQIDTDQADTGLAGPSWATVREALTGWARRQRRDCWYALPGADVTPAVAAVVALLCSRSHRTSQVRRALRHIRAAKRLGRADLPLLRDSLSMATERRQIDRFAPLIPKRKVWTDPDLLADQLHMTDTEEGLFRVLVGDDVLLATQSTLRVAARVTGTDSDQTNRMSDGRVNLAKLIGAGPEAPLRAAALRLLGTTSCTASAARCDECPLNSVCATSTAQG